MSEIAVRSAPCELKRKPSSSLPTRSKIPRNCAEQTSISGRVEEEEDSYSNGSDNGAHLDDEELHQSGISTPLTTQSSKTNPNWPSLQKTIHCPFEGCPRTFNRQAKLRDHVRSHNNDRQFVCPETGCHKDFLRKTHLDRHVKAAHTDERDYVCSYEGCGSAFSTGTRLRRHEAQHVVKEQYKCTECGQEFRKHNTLQRHVEVDHQGRKPYVCDLLDHGGAVCGAGFDKSNGLLAHQARMHVHKRYWCDICIAGVGGNQGGVEGGGGGVGAVVSGSAAGDPGQQAFDFGFGSYSEFQAHLKTIHPPTCDVCGTSCATNKQLTRHREMDHGIAPPGAESKPVHTCTEPGCGRVFTKKGNMDVHVRSVHAKQRPFVCGQVDVSALNHVEGWAGNDACGKDFKAKSQLEEHVRTAHLGLQNRTKAKKVAKEGSVGSPDANVNAGTIAMLTGTQSPSSAQTFCCVMLGCSSQFAKPEILEAHLQAVHGLDLEDNDTLFGDCEPTTASGWNENVLHQPAEPANFDFTQGLEAEAQRGGAFWIGGSPALDYAHDRESGVDSFEHIQNEMSRLVGNGHGWEDDIIMDPALLDG